MSKSKITALVKSTQLWGKKHSPEILTALGITSGASAIILAVKATPKAVELIEAEKHRINYEIAKAARDEGVEVCNQIDKLKPLDVVKITWKCYIPTAVTFAFSTACLIGASSVNVRRNAALATAYTLSESALKTYREKVAENVGEEKEKPIYEEAVKEQHKQNQVSTKEIIVTEKGHTPFYDVMAERKFTSDVDSIKRIANDLNRRMRDENSISLNDFYYAVNLSGIPIGDMVGWNIDRGYIDPIFIPDTDKDGELCFYMDFETRPTYDFE